MKIPTNNWTQTNEGDKLGTLNESQNVTLDKSGKVTLSKKCFSIYDSTSDVDFGDIQWIGYFDNEYYIVTDDELFSGDLDTGAFTEVVNVNALSNNSDSVVFNSKHYITTNANFVNSDDYTANLGALTSGVPHPITIFDSQPTYKLAIGNSNTVKIYNTSHSASSTVLTLPSQYQVTCLAYRNAFLYVGTKNINGGEAKIFVWDGDTANANYEIPVGADWVYCLKPYKNTVVGVTSSGQVIYVNGTATQQLAAFPVYFESDVRWQGTTTKGRVSRNGMAVVGDTIYIGVDGRLETGFLPQMKGGLWVFDPEHGLYHRASPSTDKFVNDTSISVTNSVITTSAAHNLVDGDVVMFSLLSGLTGVTVDTPYYASVQSTTTIKLAKSRKSLENGDFVTISGTATATDRLLYANNADQGDSYNPENVVVAVTTNLDAAQATWNSEVIWGATFETPAGTSITSLQGFTKAFNTGKITTQRIYSPKVQETWTDLFTFIDGIHNDVESVVVKAKFGNKAGYPTQTMTGVWADATHIHSVTLNVDAYADIAVDNEIIIVDGYGRGKSAHVLSIEESSGTFVIEVDESLGSASQTVVFYADSFMKIGSVGNQRESDIIKHSLAGTRSDWIQVKVELRGFETEVSHLELGTKTIKSTV